MTESSESLEEAFSDDVKEQTRPGMDSVSFILIEITYINVLIN